MNEWIVKHTNEFESWWDSLTESAQVSISAHVKLLRALGPKLGFPYSSHILNSKNKNMRELRVQHRGRPIRILYAFDPARCAILLLGGDKGSNKRWYEINIPLADKLYNKHLKSLKEEGNNYG